MNEKNIMILTLFVVYIFVIYVQSQIVEVSRKSIFLGIKIPEIKLEDERLIRINKNFKRDTWLVGILVNIGVSFWTLKSNTIVPVVLGVFILILALFLVYLRYNKKVKKIKEEENWEKYSENIRIVDLDYVEEKNKKGFNTWFKIGLFMLIFNFIFSIYMYPRLPETIPTHWNFRGEVDAVSRKSFFSVFLIDISALFLYVLLYFANLSVYKSRHEIDSKNPKLSVEKHRRFVEFWANYNGFILLLTLALFSYLNLLTLGFVTMSRYFNLLVLLGTLGITVVGFMGMFKYGQSGEKLKLDDEEIKRDKYNMEDDKYWLLGNTIYYNEDDPALFIEKRIGVGWTINLARPLGKILAITLLVVVIFTIYISFKLA